MCMLYRCCLSRVSIEYSLVFLVVNPRRQHDYLGVWVNCFFFKDLGDMIAVGTGIRVGRNPTQVRVTNNHYGLGGMNGLILNLVACRTMPDHCILSSSSGGA